MYLLASTSGLSLTPSHGTSTLEIDGAANNTETPEEAGAVFEVSGEPDSPEYYCRIDRQNKYGKGRKWTQREVNAEGSKGIFHDTGKAELLQRIYKTFFLRMKILLKCFHLNVVH